MSEETQVKAPETGAAPTNAGPAAGGPGAGGPGGGGRPGGPGGRPGGGPGGRGKFFRRKKVCKFCTEKIDAIPYRDVRLLQGFVAERGKIVPRRLTGVCTTHQRRLRVTEQVIKFITVRMDEEEKRLAKIRAHRAAHQKRSAIAPAAPAEEAPAAVPAVAEAEPAAATV